MANPPQHASPLVWAGDQLTALSETLRTFGIINWLLLGACIVGGYQAKAEYDAIAKPSHQELLVLILKIVTTSLIPILILVLSARNIKNYTSGLLKGRLDTTKEWQLVVRGQFTALKYISESLVAAKHRREGLGRLAVRELMVSTRKIVVSVFDGIEEDVLTISIGVPNAAKTMMKIVELTPPSALRQEGNEYAVNPDPAMQHTMVRSLTTGLPSNTPDAHQHADLIGKSYRSILSFPVKNSRGERIAVLNIDGPTVGMFGDSVGIGSETSLPATAHELSQPNLKALAIVITQAELYKDYRQ